MQTASSGILIVSRILAFAALMSTAFYTRAVAFNYDSPPMYFTAILFVWLVVVRMLVAPTRIVFGWLLVLVSILVSGSFSPYRVAEEKLLTQAARGVVALLSFMSMYACTRFLGSRYMYRCVMWTGVVISLFGMLQVVLGNLYGRVLYVEPTVPTFGHTGGAGAVAGDIKVYRATGTFPEPSWLAMFLLMAVLPIMIQYIRFGSRVALVASTVLFFGLASTMSVTGAVGGIMSVVLSAMASGDRVGWRRFRQLVFVVASVAICSGIVAVSLGWADYIIERGKQILAGTDVSWRTRLASVWQGIEFFEEYPLFGIGAGQYSELPEPARADVGIKSTWITTLTETGICGGVAWIVLVAALMWTGSPGQRHIKGPSVIVAWWFFLMVGTAIAWYDQWSWSILGIAIAEAGERRCGV